VKNKKVFYSVLLFCFFLCKIGSLHVYTHQDSTDLSLENCELCQSITKNDGDDFLLTQGFTDVDLKPIVEAKIELGIPNAKKSEELSTRLHSRPPPSFYS